MALHVVVVVVRWTGIVVKVVAAAMVVEEGSQQHASHSNQQQPHDGIVTTSTRGAGFDISLLWMVRRILLLLDDLSDPVVVLPRSTRFIVLVTPLVPE